LFLFYVFVLFSHAGYGRTGIVIACFFVYAYGLAPEHAIKSVRDRRPGSVQTSKQVRFVTQFAEYVAYLRTVFYPPTLTPFAVRHKDTARAKAILHAAITNGGGSSSSITGNGGFHLNIIPPTINLHEDFTSDEDDDTMLHAGGPPISIDTDDESATAAAIVASVSPSNTIEQRIQKQLLHWPPLASKLSPNALALQSSNSFPPMLLNRRHAHFLNLLVSEKTMNLLDQYTLHQTLSRQRAVLHGAERSKLKYIPKILHILTERLLDLSENNPSLFASALLEGFQRGPLIDKLYDNEYDKEKERKRVAKNNTRLQQQEFTQPTQQQQQANKTSALPQSKLGTSSSPSNAASAGSSSSTPLHVDGSLALLSTHGTMSHSALFDLSVSSEIISPVRNGKEQQPSIPSIHDLVPIAELNGIPNSSSAAQQQQQQNNSKWGLIQEDVFATLKKKINSGEWSAVETADIRYVAALLLEWLDALKVPLLPLFERILDPAPSTGSPNNNAHSAAVPNSATGLSLFVNPNTVPLPSPQQFFHSNIPRWTLGALDSIMKMMYNIRHLDMHTLARVLVRIGFALSHPRAALPEALRVARSHSVQMSTLLAHKAGVIGLTTSTLHQATQAAIQRAAQLAATGEDTKQRKPPPPPAGGIHHFDAFLSLVPAPKPLMDNLVEFLAGLTRLWNPLYIQACADEERIAASTRIGVRRAEAFEPSVAQNNAGPGAASTLVVSKIGGNHMDGIGGGGIPISHVQSPDSHLRIYQLEPTKLSAVTSVSGTTQATVVASGAGIRPTPPLSDEQQRQQQQLKHHLKRNQSSDQLLEPPGGGGVNGYGYEVSQTAYLHSHIHQSQPTFDGMASGRPHHKHQQSSVAIGNIGGGTTGATAGGGNVPNPFGGSACNLLTTTGGSNRLSPLDVDLSRAGNIPPPLISPIAGGIESQSNTEEVGHHRAPSDVGELSALGVSRNDTFAGGSPLLSAVAIAVSNAVRIPPIPLRTPALDDKEERISGFVTSRGARAAAIAVTAAATGVDVMALGGAPPIPPASPLSSDDSNILSPLESDHTISPMNKHHHLSASPSTSVIDTLAHSMSSVVIAVPNNNGGVIGTHQQQPQQVLPAGVGTSFIPESPHGIYFPSPERSPSSTVHPTPVDLKISDSTPHSSTFSSPSSNGNHRLIITRNPAAQMEDTNNVNASPETQRS
jgi:hypothetical protein